MYPNCTHDSLENDKHNILIKICILVLLAARKKKKMQYQPSKLTQGTLCFFFVMHDSIKAYYYVHASDTEKIKPKAT